MDRQTDSPHIFFSLSTVFITCSLILNPRKNSVHYTEMYKDIHSSIQYVIGEATQVYIGENAPQSLWGLPPDTVRLARLDRCEAACKTKWVREGPPKVGLSSRKWHVTALEFGEMWQISECEISFSCKHLQWVQYCPSRIHTILEPQYITSLEIGSLQV